MTLEDLDANCNNCKHMIRDFETLKFWNYYHRNLQLDEYFRRKYEKIKEVLAVEEAEGKEHPWLMQKAFKYPFNFNKEGLIQYGYCSKLNKDVSFLPNTCQIETQNCFENRRAAK